MYQCILADRLYVPEECVMPEHLNEFVYSIEEQSGYDYGPFETVTGSIRTFNKVSIGGKIYYGFARGNIEKLGRLFGDLPWVDKTSSPRMISQLQFKGQLHTWESKKIGQQEAVDAWLKKKSGVIKAPPRFGKCCSGDTIIHTVAFGSIPIKSIFDSDHQDDACVSKCIDLATKDGTQTTSFTYKKTVDTTIKITTRSGFSIEATPNHPLFIKDGNDFDWKTMQDIKLGDVLALQANTQVFSPKKTSYYSLYAKYIKANLKYSEKVMLRMMTYNKETQACFLNELLLYTPKDNGECYSVELENPKVLSLFQIVLLNFGYMFRVGDRVIIEPKQQCGLAEDVVSSIEVNNEAKDVYDVCVPVGHNFIANGVVSHNTISSIYILTKLGYKTLIVAHQIDLLEQYYASFSAFTNVNDLIDVTPKQKKRDAKGRVFGFFDDYNNPEELDVCLLCWQTFASKAHGADRLAEYGRTWGLVIVDECHRSCGAIYARTVNRLMARYRLGLTGTVERVDGREFLLKEIIGPVAAEGKVATIPCKVVIKHTAIKVNYSFTEPLPSLYKRIYKATGRMDIILDDLQKDVDAGRYVCFAFHRCSIQQLCEWTEKLKGLGIAADAFYGSCKDREGVLRRTREGEIRVLVCNSQMLTGIDIPRWNTYYSAFPTSNVVFNEDGDLSGNFYQEFSRIRTPFIYEDGKEKTEGIIRDYVDNNSMCFASYKKRYKAYKNQNFPIEIVKMLPPVVVADLN
jgi:hypothetical protein